jgi:hypothetical protein
MLNEENIVYVPLKEWKLGNAKGAYEPSADIIYILLSDEAEMDKALRHELIHRARRNKLTFKLARLINTPILKAFMDLFLLVSIVYVCLSLLFNHVPELTPILSVALIYLASLFSKLYEEKQANKRGEPTE